MVVLKGKEGKIEGDRTIITVTFSLHILFVHVQLNFLNLVSKTNDILTWKMAHYCLTPSRLCWHFTGML